MLAATWGDGLMISVVCDAVTAIKGDVAIALAVFGQNTRMH